LSYLLYLLIYSVALASKITSLGLENAGLKPIPGRNMSELEIRSVERGICPIVTLYSPEAAFQCLTLL